MLLSVHMMGAALLKTPELAIDAQEAQMLAKASAAVAEHYDFIPDPKTQAWFNLVMVAGTIYGPRLFVIAGKRRQPQVKPATPPAPASAPQAVNPMEVSFEAMYPQ